MATATISLVDHLRSALQTVVGETFQVRTLEQGLKAAGWEGEAQVSKGTHGGLPCRVRSYPGAVKGGLLVAKFRLGEPATLEVVRGMAVQDEVVGVVEPKKSVRGKR